MGCNVAGDHALHGGQHPSRRGRCGWRRLQPPGGLAHRIRRPAAHRQALGLCGWRRNASRHQRCCARSPLRWMLPCSRATRRRFRGESTGTRSRSATPRAAVWRCAPHWPMCPGQHARRGAFCQSHAARQAKRTTSGAFNGRHVQHHHQVHAGVHLGVVLGGLGHAQARHFAATPAAPATRAAPRTCARALLPSGRAPVPATRAPGTRWITSPCSTISRISCMVSRCHGEVGKNAPKRSHAQDAHRVFAEPSVTCRGRPDCRSHAVIWVK